MSISFMEPVISPAQKYFSIVLSRVNRIVNRSVARMLANRARQVSRFMLRRLGGRPSNDGVRRSRPINRSALFALMIAGLSSPVLTRAEGLIVREHHGARAQPAAAQQRERHRCRHRSEWSVVVASAIPATLDRRTE
jgi:hypothetical protein